MAVDTNKHAFEVGTYHCVMANRRVLLEEPATLASLEWPVVVERCAACGQRHVLQYDDVRHPPTYGYE